MESFSTTVLMGMEHMSESLYVRMCQIVGTSQQVLIRRESQDFLDMINRQIAGDIMYIQMLSGSMREGFKLKGSDVDMMYWPNSYRVIMEMSQSENYNIANRTLILSDSSKSPPGFTLLQLLTSARCRYVRLACVRINGRFCISSSLYRQLTFSLAYPNSTVHGPCASVNINGAEIDSAMCFVCDFWPVSASSWIDRCRSWPKPEVVDDIVRNGCHFVAIGHPLGLHENEEWRISFSQAEYKCVSAMNHCQFLTYGLLKLFLNEVINQQSEVTNKLLCSYHMKTIVFWVIQKNVLPQWCPLNILVGFWVCFKLLLKWVYEGDCPNFFIPQNNLFLTKIHGSAQNRLFLQLHELYKKGLACLLQSSSVRSFITVLYNPRLSFSTDDRVMSCEVKTDLELFYKAMSTGQLFKEVFEKCIHVVEHLINLPLTECQFLLLQSITVCILRETAFVLQNKYTNPSNNKIIYNADKMSCQMLKLSAKFGFVSDTLYIAIYYYRTCRYRNALSVIQMTKFKLAQPYIAYQYAVDRERYTEAVGGQSWSTKIRKAVARDIRLDPKIVYINELIPEQLSLLKNQCQRWALYIPLLVMLPFLEFLCYRHIDTTLSQEALDELQALVHHGRRLYVHECFKDISWEILGICQQITGNHQAALYSYQQSLTQYPWNKIQTATQTRIQDIVGTAMN